MRLLEPSSQSSPTPTTKRHPLGYNVVLNLLGLVVPVLVGMLVIPPLIRLLGSERFGLLSLAWALLTYLTLFDLGLGRATSKLVAEKLGSVEETHLPRMIWTAALVQGLVGGCVALGLYLLAPALVERWPKLPPGLHLEAHQMLEVLALTVPVLLVSASLSGVLEGARRFDLVNLVRGPANALLFALPLWGALRQQNLSEILLLILGLRVLVVVVLFGLCQRLIPHLKKIDFSWQVLPGLLGFGGWLTLANAVVPLFTYLDRFMIGAFLSLGAVAQYVAPMELISRLNIFPAALTSALFPELSRWSAEGMKAQIGARVLQTMRYLLIGIAPVVVVILMLAPEVLKLWLGSGVSEESVLVLRILAIAVLLNTLGHPPYTLVQAVGRPDMIAKYHLAEVPIYVGGMALLILKLGIAGAAWAWLLRMLITIPLFSWLALRVAGLKPDPHQWRLLRQSLVVAGLSLAITVVLWEEQWLLKVALLGLLLGFYAVGIWYFTFDSNERDRACRVLVRWLLRK